MPASKSATSTDYAVAVLGGAVDELQKTIAIYEEQAQKARDEVKSNEDGIAQAKLQIESLQAAVKKVK